MSSFTQVGPAASLPDVHAGHAGVRGDVDGVREGGQDDHPEEGGDDGRDLRQRLHRPSDAPRRQGRPLGQVRRRPQEGDAHHDRGVGGQGK